MDSNFWIKRFAKDDERRVEKLRVKLINVQMFRQAEGNFAGKEKLNYFEFSIKSNCISREYSFPFIIIRWYYSQPLQRIIIPPYQYNRV